MKYICIFSIILASLKSIDAGDCNSPATCTVKSLTTTTGSKAKVGPFCSGDLIFEEKFDTLDNTLWVPEVTMNGGGVRFRNYFYESFCN